MIRKALTVMACLGMMVPSLASAEARPVLGLIVKLRAQPPTAVEGTRAMPQARVSRLARVAQAAGYTSAMPWRSLGGEAASLRVPTRLNRETAQQMMTRVLASGEVEWVELNVRERLLQATPVEPNDPFYALSGQSYARSQWWLKQASSGSSTTKEFRQRGAANINLAWQVSTGRTQTNGVVIAILDTGTVSHPDIDASRVLPGYDFVSDLDSANEGGAWGPVDGRDADARDPGDWVTAQESASGPFQGCGQQTSSWHGLVIEGLLAARSNNADGVAGINWGARLLPVRVAGKCGAAVDDIIDGLRWAAGLRVDGVPDNPTPARLINISFGGSGACGSAYQAAINEVRARGALVVASAGNEHGEMSRPANCSGVVGVVGLGREGLKTTYSNFGPSASIATMGGDPNAPYAEDPGLWADDLADEGILTVANWGETRPDFSGAISPYAYHAGTSYSAPLVVGVLSLMLDVNPSLTVSQLQTGLRLSARKHVVSNVVGTCSNDNPGRCVCTTSSCGWGILDAQQALAYAQNPGSYVPPAWPDENIDSVDVLHAVASASQDRGPNARISSSGDGGGGGGAVQPWEWLALILLASLAWVQRGSQATKPLPAGKGRLLRR